MISPDNLAISSCSLPEPTLPEILNIARDLGYRKFELFTGTWANSAVDYHSDDIGYFRELSQETGVSYCSFHLPPFVEDEPQSLAEAVKAAFFAEAIGVPRFLVKGKTMRAFETWLPEFLERTEKLNAVPMLQNHAGTPITHPEHFIHLFDTIANPRLRAVFEVGMFLSCDVDWHEAHECLRDFIELVHIKDQIGTERVPFGQGQLDFRDLFTTLEKGGYQGDVVVEMEVCQRDTRRTIELLRDARRLLVEVLTQLHSQ